MNWMCKIFGHKYIGRIVTRIDFITKSSHGLDEPRCKRCGKRMYEE